ncbi:PREDICTED: centromere protein F [Habropoda laboriosa]|uniref:centromere protein F n=1 Tax=Habropoda laboriosa TaxID=597456 RepID=UPI00083D14A6|nr:PREDICTED: centromere protein F [Habropoda laboriosa]
MAFSFRISTKWCHDFPKLATESGFYFNMHRSRVRIDWNRISNIDIDRIIRERDFHSIDDNISNVIDYCLESEYDIKILDSNFVKLFRLAQLAVEYLLYCKQYLDHSVIILKDELKLKIEENVKLKKQITTLDEVIKHMKEKAKERSKLIETRIADSNGEIYKCPHCPKTFISPVFVSAHILRRHTYATELYMPSSPIHEHYRSETERLHNEIKNLKERLNETERVIRNESEKVSEKKTLNYDKRQVDNEIESYKHDNNKSEEHPEYKGYQEEIRTLKTMLFDEIHNLRQKEKTMYERTSETNVQTLINQQEKEFQKLRNQLFEKLTPDIENMHAKLHAQENYWKSKIEHLENQHHKDVENLTTELKLTQKAADNMKAEYESKVSDLERQTANQSNILIEQSKQLHSLSHEINISQLNEKNKNLENNLLKTSNESIMLNKTNEISEKQNDHVDAKTEQIIIENSTRDTIINSSLLSKVFPLTLENKFSKTAHTSDCRNKSIIREDKSSTKGTSTKNAKSEKLDHVKSIEKNLKYYSSSDISVSEDSTPQKGNDYKIKRKHPENSIIKIDIKESDINKSQDAFNKNMSNEFSASIKNTKQLETLEDTPCSATSSELSISDSNTDSVTTIHNNSSLHEYKIHSSLSLKSRKITETNSSYKQLEISLIDAFEQKLKDLGIDPEWQGIPKATFKQKMDILKHHQKLVAKKSPKYHQIKLKIIEEVLNKISKKGKGTENFKHLKKSPSNKVITNIKSTTIKVRSDQKDSGKVIPPNRFHSIPETNHNKNVIENESTLIRPTKSANYKRIERLIQIAPNPVKSLEDVQYTVQSQESLIRKDSLNKMESLFNSEPLKITSNNKCVLDSKSVQNGNVSNSNMQQDLQDILISPKHNKSVLKSATGSTSSLTKKKVIFDLTNEKSKESSSDEDIQKEGLNESNWNISSISDEGKYLSEQDYKSSNNIVLKTSQSDKIAEISRKLEAQLNMVRQKPVGSVETIFTSTFVQNKENHNKSNEQLNSTSISSLLESPIHASISNFKKPNDLLPQPAPRNLKDKISETLRAESISEISDLDSDIDKILKL